MKIVINNTNKLLNSSTLSTFKPKNLVQTVKNFGNKGLKYASIAATSLGLATLAISKPSNIRLIDSIPDGAELDYDSTKKLFEACRNSDFTCKYELLNDTLKKVACTKGKDESTQIIIDLINSFGDLNDITKKYPKAVCLLSGIIGVGDLLKIISIFIVGGNDSLNHIVNQFLPI